MYNGVRLSCSHYVANRIDEIAKFHVTKPQVDDVVVRNGALRRLTNGG
jgi:hypothetical protein